MSLQNSRLSTELIKKFQQVIQSKRFAHAYIFHADESTPKTEIALQFAKAINCKEHRLDACDQCTTCMQIEHGNHPDVMIIQPQGIGIKIDQLRELRKKFHYQSPAGVTRVVIFEQADLMRAEAANSLLKFLEEPPSPLVAILLTDKVQAILPTIQSRCQKIQLTTQSTQAGVASYQSLGLPDHLAQVAAQFSYPIELSKDELLLLCEQAIEFADLLLTDKHDRLFIRLLEWLNVHTDHIKILLDLLLFWIREVLYFQATSTSRYFAYWQQSISQQASCKTSTDLLLILENLMIARRLLSKPALRQQSIIEQMLVAMTKKQLMQESGWQLIIL